MATLEQVAAACVALFFACALSSAGGVGGGGLNVPIFVIFCGFNFDVSSSLSLFVVLGNSVAQTLLNYNQPHPLDGRLPMIFWTFVCLLLPAQLGGGNIGGALKRTLSEETLYALALVVLTFAATVSLRKGLLKWRAETAELSRPAPAQPAGESTDNPLQPAADVPRSSALEVDTVATAEAQAARQSAPPVAITWPWATLAALALMWLAQLLLRSGAVFTARCSASFWGVFASIYAPLLLCSAWGLSLLHLEARADGPSATFARVCANIPAALLALLLGGGPTDGPTDGALGATLAPSERLPRDSDANAIDLRAHGWYLLVFVFVIGLVANLLGIGGAELISPLLLVLHASPEVASATSGSMNLLNTAANVVVNLLTLRRQRVSNNDDDEAHHDETPPLYAVLFLVGFAGGLLGRYAGLYVAKKLRRASVIIFALVGGLYLTCAYYVYALAAGGLDRSADSFCET
eukprot:gene15175-10862_t